LNSTAGTTIALAAVVADEDLLLVADNDADAEISAPSALWTWIQLGRRSGPTPLPL
jgi:hypothetical protein